MRLTGPRRSMVSGMPNARWALGVAADLSVAAVAPALDRAALLERARVVLARDQLHGAAQAGHLHRAQAERAGFRAAAAAELAVLVVAPAHHSAGLAPGAGEVAAHRALVGVEQALHLHQARGILAAAVAELTVSVLAPAQHVADLRRAQVWNECDASSTTGLLGTGAGADVTRGAQAEAAGKWA